jgi:hypothetical protein
VKVSPWVKVHARALPMVNDGNWPGFPHVPELHTRHSDSNRTSVVLKESSTQLDLSILDEVSNRTSVVLKESSTQLDLSILDEVSPLLPTTFQSDDPSIIRRSSIDHPSIIRPFLQNLSAKYFFCLSHKMNANSLIPWKELYSR